MLKARCSKLVVLLLATICVGELAAAIEPARVDVKRFIPATLARFELVLGRLQLSSEYFRIGAAFDRSTLEDGRERTRSISVSTYRGRPTLQFRDSGGDENIQLSFKADRKVDIEQTSGRDGERYTLKYRQSDSGPITVHIAFDDGRTALEFKSISLWHLAVEEPQVFDEYLHPLIVRLEPSWQITRIAAMVRGLARQPKQDFIELDRLIEQLDAAFSTERRSAMTQLESMGVTAEPRLRQSLSNNLTSQQEQSVKRLLSSLQPTGNDTPMRIAVWLSNELR
jgi:hypothetical protein